MRYSLGSVLVIVLLAAACSNEPPVRDHRWFNTYQSDRSCHTSRPPVRNDDIHGPTGRAHPF